MAKKVPLRQCLGCREMMPNAIEAVFHLCRERWIFDVL